MLASTTSTHSGEESAKQKPHQIVGRSGSITINVRMSTGSASDLQLGKQRRSSKTSGSDVPSITIDGSSLDHATQSTSSLCEILPDDSEYCSVCTYVCMFSLYVYVCIDVYSTCVMVCICVCVFVYKYCA